MRRSITIMTVELILLCLVSLCAGFIDSIIGGGGLLQTPAMLVILPQYPIATLFGTTKIPSLTGTAFAAMRYSRHVKLDFKVLTAIILVAFGGSMLGAYCISVVSATYVKPVVLVILIAVGIYTFSKKDMGLRGADSKSMAMKLIAGACFGFVIGFYDGLIGPGTGTFLILSFITFLNYDFLRASAAAKYVNVATNVAAMIYFAGTGHILYEYAIPMALFNLAGSYLGTRMALLRGNAFIRKLFLIVVSATILKFAWDIVSA